ncbi:hypothetical protein ACLB2K_006619 [Fragaria x ananassa]
MEIMEKFWQVVGIRQNIPVICRNPTGFRRGSISGRESRRRGNWLERVNSWRQHSKSFPSNRRLRPNHIKARRQMVVKYATWNMYGDRTLDTNMAAMLIRSPFFSGP